MVMLTVMMMKIMSNQEARSLEGPSSERHEGGFVGIIDSLDNDEFVAEASLNSLVEKWKNGSSSRRSPGLQIIFRNCLGLQIIFRNCITHKCNNPGIANQEKSVSIKIDSNQVIFID